MKTKEEVQTMLEKVHNSAFHMRERNSTQRVKKDLLYAIMQTLAWVVSDVEEVDENLKKRVDVLVQENNDA